MPRKQRAEREPQQGLPRPTGKLVHRGGEKSAIMAEISEFNGKTYVQIRKWAKIQKAGGWVRTSQGIGVPAEAGADLLRVLGALLRGEASTNPPRRVRRRDDD